MNAWSSIATCAVATLVVALGCSPEPRPVAPAPAAPAPAAPAAPAGAAACNNQPNMSAALGELRAARGSLDKAEHDKGGWRVKAIEATETATRETERGCAFADTH
jgi:hypothetical protein